MTRYEIMHLWGVPLDFNGLSWDTVLTEATCAPKSAEFRTRYLDALLTINARTHRRYHEISEITFVPILSPWLSMDALQKEPWFTDARILKIIPIFDHVTDAYFTERLPHFLDGCPQSIIMIHTGWGAPILPLEPLIQRYSKKHFVIAYMKEDTDAMNHARIRLLQTYSNVSMELSSLSSPKRLHQYVHDYHFADRILFGSDLRTDADAVSFQWFSNAVTLCNFSAEVTAKIFYRNAQQLMQKYHVPSPQYV